MKHFSCAIIGSLLAAGCSVPGASENTSLQAGASHVRLCDEPIDYAIKPAAETTRPEDKPYYGIWKGEVAFSGSTGTMCIGMVVQEIQQNKADNMWAWNLGAGRDMSNFQGMGSVNWSGRMEGGRMILDSDQPYLGNFYSFEFSPPDEKGEIHGKFKVEGANHTRTGAYPVVMYRYTSPVSPSAPAIASR